MKRVLFPLCATLLFAGGAAGVCVDVPLASAAPEAVLQTAPKAVQAVEYVDAEDNLIKVVTFDDGSIAVSVNGDASVLGADAMRLLSDHGVALSVSPQGQFLRHDLAARVKVKQAARVVTPGEAKAASAARSENGIARAAVPARSSLVLPANVAAGSGMQTQQAIFVTTGKVTTDTDSAAARPRDVELEATGQPVSK